MTLSPRLKKRLPIFIIIIIAIVGSFTLRDFLSFETLRQNNERLSAFRDHHFFATSLAFMAVYFDIVTFSFPGAAIATLTGGFLFGVFPGVLFNVIGASAGGVAVFLAAKAGFGRDAAAKIESSDGPGRKLLNALRENEWSALFIMRLVPAVPFFIANLLPAFVGTSLWRFAITTFFGIIPGTLVFTSVGSGLENVFAQGKKPDLSIFFEPHIIGPILGLAALSALPILIKLVKKKER